MFGDPEEGDDDREHEQHVDDRQEDVDLGGDGVDVLLARLHVRSEVLVGDRLHRGLAVGDGHTLEPAHVRTAVGGRNHASTTGGCWRGGVFRNTSLLLAKVRATEHEDNWERDRPGFGSPGSMDRVFFSCAACHVGRVVVDGKMKFLPGMPNTEIEAQYFSKLLMLTAAALVESGFDPQSTTPVNPANIKPDTGAIRALYTEMLDKARQRPETLYGSAPADIARAKIQALAIADEFPSVMQDLIAVGVKTHFIYYVVAKNNAYRQPRPDVLEDRPGQMDAFGIASGLVAIHSRRPDNSFLEFVRRDNPQSPIFTGFSTANGMPADVPGMTDAVTDPKAAADRIFKNIPAWAPPVPAPIDIKSVNWAVDRYHANWDGNQGASSRTLASGASATGDPRMVNVRIHEPLNPFIDNLPPPPYPFRSVDLARAREGKALFRENCASCHKPRNEDDLSGLEARRRSEPHARQHQRVPLRAGGAGHRGVPDLRPEQPGSARRRLVRAGGRLAGAARRVLPRHATPCRRRHATATRRTCCTASGRRRRTCTTDRCRRWGTCCAPPRARRGSCAATCTTTRRWWASNGALGRRRATARTRFCSSRNTTRQWPARPTAATRSARRLCPDTSGLDPVRDRAEIQTRILQSPAGALLEYLKTL